MYDVSLLAELLELLILVLELMACEAASLGLEVKSRTMKLLRSLSCLGSLIHSSVQSTHNISRRSAIARAAMQSLDNQIWRSRRLNDNEAEVVQHVHSAYLPIWVRLLGSLEDRTRTIHSIARSLLRQRVRLSVRHSRYYV